MNPNATNKTCTGPKWVRTQQPEDEEETPKSPPGCSQTGSFVAPYKSTTPNPPFRQ